MGGTVGIFTKGIWRLRHDVAMVTGLQPVRRRYTARGLDAVTGWGFKATAAYARDIAARHGLTYLAMEDGFLRSRQPGPSEPALSYVCDPVGIYYDSRGPSALEGMIHARHHDIERATRDAELVIQAIRERGLSKYTHFDPDARNRLFRLAESGSPVVVVDQTVGDAAVTGAGAGRSTFLAMLISAVAENPGSPVLIKGHPETRLGRRPGYLDRGLIEEARARNPAVADAVAAGRLSLFTDAVPPRDLAAVARRIYAVSSLLGFETLIAGASVSLFGKSFYAGWGLTDDRMPATGRRGAVPLVCLIAAAYRDYLTFMCPQHRRPCSIDCILGADIGI